MRRVIGATWSKRPTPPWVVGAWYWIAIRGPMRYRGPSPVAPFVTPTGMGYYASDGEVVSRLTQSDLDDYRRNCAYRQITVPAIRQEVRPTMERYYVVEEYPGSVVERQLIVLADSEADARERPHDQEILASRLVCSESGEAHTTECRRAEDEEFLQFRAMGYYSTAMTRGQLVDTEAILNAIETSSDYESLVERLARLCGWRRRDAPDG